MYAKVSCDILSAMGLSGSRYSIIRHNDKGNTVVQLPMPGILESHRISDLLVQYRSYITYAMVDMHRQQLKLKVTNDAVPPARARHAVQMHEKFKIDGISKADANHVRNVASTLTSASIDDVQPIFEVAHLGSQCCLFACKPASKYNHLHIMEHMPMGDDNRQLEWVYNCAEEEISVNVPLEEQSRKRRKR